MTSRGKKEILEFLERRLKKLNETFGFCKGDERFECMGRIREVLEMKWRIERGSDDTESDERWNSIISGKKE